MVVIVMNAHADDKSTLASRGSGAAPTRGRPLYRRGAHWFARTGFGLMLLLYLVGVVAVVSTFTAHPLGWRDVVGFFLMIVFPLIVGTNLRTWAVYGSVHGLEIVRWGRRRVVPWARVGTAEYAWWSLNHASRLARLTLHDELPTALSARSKDETIFFFANDRLLAELEAMRVLYAGR
jgi:hypothetical protein